MNKKLGIKAVAVVGVAGALLVMDSCKVQKSVAKYELATSREVKGMGVLQVPTLTDLDIAPTRITYEYEQNILSKQMKKFRNRLAKFSKLSLKARSQNQQLEEQLDERSYKMGIAMQQIAKSQMLITYGADILIDPRFSIEVINNEKVKVIVSGYLGTYKNFRPMQAKDTALFQISPTIYVPEYNMNGIIIRN